MFDNIDSKLKTLATTLCVILIICSIIAGIAIMATVDFLIGLLIAAVGSLLSWASSFFIYAFGQLIENSETIIYQNKKIVEALTDIKKIPPINNNIIQNRQTASEGIPKQISNSNSAQKNTHRWVCSSCGQMISSNPCPYCNFDTQTDLDFPDEVPYKCGKTDISTEK